MTTATRSSKYTRTTSGISQVLYVALRTFAQTLRSNDRVVLEATVNTWPIADLLGAHAGQVIVSNPMRTRAIAAPRSKPTASIVRFWRSCSPPTLSLRSRFQILLHVRDGIKQPITSL